MSSGLQITISVETSNQAFADEKVLSVYKVLETVIQHLYSFFWVNPRRPRFVCRRFSETGESHKRENTIFITGVELLDD
jgi:hypothetical protein